MVTPAGRGRLPDASRLRHHRQDHRPALGAAVERLADRLLVAISVEVLYNMILDRFIPRFALGPVDGS